MGKEAILTIAAFIFHAVISFELADNTEGTPQAPPRLVEGDSIQNFLKIMKSGLTNFAYYVTLKVEALTNLSGKVFQFLIPKQWNLYQGSLK